MKLIFSFIILFAYVQLSAQSMFRENLSEPTSYSDMINYLQETTRMSNIFELGWIGKSHEGRSIPFVKVSSTGFKKDSNKAIFMVFAQQHGNEPAGKEALLSLLEDFKDKKLDYLLDKIDFLIVPQVNPDAAEISKRIGSSGYDLNRSHITLFAEETLALHELFYRYLPDVTLDLHEYFPYTQEWKELGIRKNFDVTLGLLTNPNVAKELINISKNKVLPFVKEFVENNGYSFSEYTLGIVPQNQPVRFSNLGIYDGRQSFGILNTLSFIVEGRNGEQVNSNLNNRRQYEKTAMLALCNFVYKNCDDIKNIVNDARHKLLNSKEGEIVSIRTKYGLGKDPYTMKL
ncbi:MAG: M14 family zinc carboxypeptidase, partial [Melioribacteraceae bacterium]